MKKPSRYYIRLTAVMPDGGEYHAQRVIANQEIQDTVLDVVQCGFDETRRMIAEALCDK